MSCYVAFIFILFSSIDGFWSNAISLKYKMPYSAVTVGSKRNIVLSSSKIMVNIGIEERKFPKIGRVGCFAASEWRTMDESRGSVNREI